ncbi:malignant T-cell-amplified sequence 1 isoform X1 [Oncorhynchus masou masou]|uniref:malignant T-cell-amplified sequence 1 isoform X1 n=1 Tax=Oncorhynchus masou masou TaxID=90313 RepID=UPI003183FA64
MFKKFDEKENVSNCIQLKTSVIKGIKNQLLDQFPDIESWLNHIMPKKDPVKIVRCHEHIEILTVNGELLFFRQREGPFYPTLRLLHKYPFILPHQQVDKGAIKFVLSGANIMCPGLTSPGAKLYPSASETVVAIMAEGKQHALCVGVMKMSAEDMKEFSAVVRAHLMFEECPECVSFITPVKTVVPWIHIGSNIPRLNCESLKVMSSFTYVFAPQIGH